MYIQSELEWFEWDPAKAATNLRKHGVRFADAAVSLTDPRAFTMADPDAVGEERFVTLAADPAGVILVTVFAFVEQGIRVISSRKASFDERRRYVEG